MDKRRSEHKAKYYQVNKERFRLQHAKYYQDNKERIRLRWHGIVKLDHMRILEQQRYVCAICGGSLVEREHVDHDHITGRVRGILCGHCNNGLGLFKDNRESLIRAVAYLG